MTSSGTYNFNPAISEVVLDAYSRIQIRRSELLAEHLTVVGSAFGGMKGTIGWMIANG